MLPSLVVLVTYDGYTMVTRGRHDVVLPIGALSYAIFSHTRQWMIEQAHEIQLFITCFSVYGVKYRYFINLLYCPFLAVSLLRPIQIAYDTNHMRISDTELSRSMKYAYASQFE